MNRNICKHLATRRQFKLVDTVTQKDFNKGWFPIYSSEMDTFISMIEKFENLFKLGLKRMTFNLKDLSTDHLEFIITNVKKAYADRYDITIISEIDAIKTSLKLCDADNPNKMNEEKIKAFIAHLKRNKKVRIEHLQ
jgi:hypothetical protein